MPSKIDQVFINGEDVTLIRRETDGFLGLGIDVGRGEDFTAIMTFTKNPDGSWNVREATDEEKAACLARS